MACIFKRGKTWSYSVDIGRDETGKRKKKGKGGFRTQKEAKEAAAIMEAELANGIFVDEKKITFGEFANKWLQKHRNEIKPTSLYIYEYAVNKLNNIFNNTILKNITKIQYQKFLDALFEENYSYKSLQLVHVVSRLIFKYACECDIIKNNPMIYAKIPKHKISVEDLETTSDIPKYLEKDELNIFLEYIRNSNELDYTIFMTLAYTGMRRGELTALKWSDIDFKDQTISINKTIFFRNSNTRNYSLQTPKTKTSKRIISVTNNVTKALSKHRLTQKQIQLSHRQDWHDKNFVFTSPTFFGYPIYPLRIWKAMKKYLFQANLNTVLTPHSLHHTHTSLLAEAGVSLEAIMDRLGHSNDVITRTIYLHITQETKKDAAQKFFELMNSTSR